MTEPLRVVLEALRRVQAKVSFYAEPGNRNAHRALLEITAVVEDGAVVEAIKELSDAPALVPDKLDAG
jgi:hypothetical protein